MPFEHAVEDHRGQHLHRPLRDAHVVDRAEVLVAAVEVLHRSGPPFSKNIGSISCPPPPTCSTIGMPASSACRHTGSRPDVARGVVAGAGRGHEQRGGALPRAPRRPWRPSARSRPAARSRWAAAGRRPSRTRPWPGCGPAPRRRPGRGRRPARGPTSRPLLKVLKTSWLATPMRSRASGRSSARNEPVAFQFFRVHDLLGVPGAELRVGVALPEVLEHLGLARGQAQPVGAGQEPLAHLRVGVLAEPRGLLHDVGVGVVHDAPLDVRHRSPCAGP